MKAKLKAALTTILMVLVYFIVIAFIALIPFILIILGAVLVGYVVWNVVKTDGKLE